MPGPPEPIDAGAVQIPYYFRCPISLELMSDPVTVSTGQTYDRASIESWISTGNTTCPVTRSPLSDFSLIPNHTLRRLIQEWCVANHSFGVQRIPTPKQPADPSLLRSLLSQLSSLPTPSRASVLTRLSRLARDSDKNRALLSSLPNTRDVLLSILFSPESDLAELRNESLALLALFQLGEFECNSIASDPDRVAFLVGLLFEPNRIDVRVNSAAVIESVVAGTRSAELRSRVSGADGVFEGIVGVMREGGVCVRAVKVGVKALFALCLAKQHRQRAVAAGAVEVLVDLMAASSDLEKGDAERALATVELLCRVPAGCAAFSSHSLTAPLLVRTILKVSERATEYAAGALLAVCSASERVQREAVAAGLMTQLLLLVQSDCTERAKRKAQMLLKMLRDSWPEDTIGNSDDFNCSDVVPY